METLVLALGNELMKDDGVGIKVGRILLEKGYNVLEVGTDIFRLSSYYGGEGRIVIIDAVLSSELEPGEVIHLRGDEIFEKLRGEIRSAHFMGAIDGLRLLMLLDERLSMVDVHFIGVVVKEIGLGTELSREVEKGLSKAVELVEELCKN
ncbi:protein frxA [Thermococcus sp. P6]|uniref:hydrogenase maturation protease n=1 Tax=Thermococcus sp. P6 TaxID=122420 RepID=UPI000B59FC6E|nr:hydrogenase maturation protease [Thermococcus sp. P6]ASJ10789.1 protein frxA [Thermococcus sp. P6]